jgi:hypothetical protein
MPTSKDNKLYNHILAKFEKVGPVNDPMFRVALDMLHQTNPVEASKKLNRCFINSRTAKKSSRASKASRTASRTSGSTSRRNSRNGTVLVGGVKTAPPPYAPPSLASANVKPKDKGRLKCYLKVMAKMAFGAASVATAGYYLMAPFLTSAIGSPCKGFTDQVFGAFAGIYDNRLSCSGRQAAYDEIVTNYLTGLVTSTGVPLGVIMWKSPELFGLVMKYLLAKECPSLYARYTWDDLIGDWERIRRENPAIIREESKAAEQLAKSAKENASEEKAAEPDDSVASRRKR